MKFIEYVEQAAFIKVKPCPFCGTNGSVIERNKNDMFRIRCKVCCTRQEYMFDTPIKAAQKWNVRIETDRFKIIKAVNGKIETHIETNEEFFNSLKDKDGDE